MNTVNILGVKLNNLNGVNIDQLLLDYLNEDKQRLIFTPNPEILLHTHKDEEYFHIINRADLCIPDGIGLKFAAFLVGVNLRRLTGADLCLKLLELASEKNYSVLVLNWEHGLSKANDISNAISKQYPNVNILVEDISRDNESLNLKKINAFKPLLILSSLGFPYQEKVLFHNIGKIPSAKIGIGIGGTLDYLSGKAKRAPKTVSNIGLEWLWRLFVASPGKKAWRIKRVFKATVLFTFKVLFWRFVQPHLYRPNVACMLYREHKGAYEILLVERSDEENHWQLPQGGRDHNPVEIAGRRELKEEVNVDNLEITKIIPSASKYKFNKGLGKSSYQTPQRHTGYKGQRQDLFIAKYLGQGDEIKINYWDHKNYKWVHAEKLVETVHPLRQPSALVFYTLFEKYVLKKNN